MSLTPRALYVELQKQLMDFVANPESQALWILQKRLGLDKTGILMSDVEMSAQQNRGIQSDIKAVQSGTPLTRHYGEAEFWGLSFDLSAATLDPRPDTEIIIETALQIFDKDQPLRILDLGTGSGCILVALLHEFPKSSGIGLDVSDDAIQAATHNAQKNNVSGRAEFLSSDWYGALGHDHDNSFDLIVSNPPYIESEAIAGLDDSVKNHDPILALDGGEDGLQAYKIIFSDFLRFLKLDGVGLFEIGYQQCEQISRLSKDSRIRMRRIISDYAGNQRVAELCALNANGDK